MEKTNYTYDKKRFETFLDAIFAIILTILVLELKVPALDHIENPNTKQICIELIPNFISYIGSFLLIVGIWIDHNLLMLNMLKINKRFILLNMFFVLSLSIVPFTTAFAGHFPKDSFTVALLFTNYCIMNILFGQLYWYAQWKKILHPDYVKENKRTAIYSQIGILGLILAIPIAYFNTYVAFVMGIVIFSGHLFKKI